MPFRFEMGPGDNRCTLHLSGVVTAEDLHEMIARQIGEGAWECQALIDTTEAIRMDLTFNDMLEQGRLVERATRALPRRGAVVILAPGPQVYGMARMYESATAGELPFPLTVTQSRQEAEQWLAAQKPPALSD